MFFRQKPCNSSELRRGESGAVAVETALTVVPFMLFLLASFEIAIMFFGLSAVDAAVGEAVTRGRIEDPYAIQTNWSSEEHAFPFSEEIGVPEFHCYPTAADLVSAELDQIPPVLPQNCGSARAIAWKATMQWHAITPFLQWAVPDGFHLTARGVSYR